MNPQGSSLVRVRAGCRRRSACPSEYRAPAAGIEPASPRLTAGYSYQHEFHRNRRVRQSGWPDSNRRFPAPKAGGLARLSYIPSRLVHRTSAQRESNPHVRHGEAVGYRYIMGTIAVTGLSKSREHRVGLEPTSPPYEGGVFAARRPVPASEWDRRGSNPHRTG